MYTEKLTITDFRCFAQQKMTFNWPNQTPPKGEEALRQPNVNLLIGNNGTGKTTIFQALAIAAMGPYLASNSSGFRTPTAIRYGKDVAEAVGGLLLAPIDTEENPAPDTAHLHLSAHRATSLIKREGTTQSLSTRTRATHWKESLFYEDRPASFLAAYGANRRIERPEAYNKRLRGPRYQQIATLFESHIGLMPLSAAYSLCKERMRWDEVVHIVNALLQPPVQLTTHSTDGEPLFDYDGILLPVAEISDGYRLFVGWLIDCLTHLAQVLPKHQKLTEAIGMIIVDEVDLFLSPVWQRTVMESLATAFPRIQWFCSTHSPLVAGTLESKNLFMVERCGPYTSAVRPCDEKVFGLSIDTILVRLFGLESPRAPELEMQLAELEKKARQGDRAASLEYMQRLRLGVK